MITPDGWFDWAIRMPGPANKVNRLNGEPLYNACRGVFMHSAEGYAHVLIDLLLNGPNSWGASNLMDGSFIQHYPVTVQTWHATAGNTNYFGCENEGLHTREMSLNEAQIANAVRMIADLAAWGRWQPRRPANSADITHTLWEHNEVVRLGGSGSLCPSGRIPWDEILLRLKEPSTPDDAELRLGVIETLVSGKYKPVALGRNGINELVVELRNQDGTQAQPPIIVAVPRL